MNRVSGNNALSYKGVQANVTTESDDNLTFVFVQNPTVVPTNSTNLDAARVNTFYLVNRVHDIAYKYGSTEAAFNFQNDNFGKGGKAFDRVIVSVQTTPGTDNAYFTTPPDGINGQMHLFLWDYTSPMRDGALENDIVVHEVGTIPSTSPQMMLISGLEHARHHEPHDWRWHRQLPAIPRSRRPRRGLVRRHGRVSPVPSPSTHLLGTHIRTGGPSTRARPCPTTSSGRT